MRENETYNKIVLFLNEIESISKGEVLLSIKPGKNGYVKVWKHYIQLPRKEKDVFYLILPNRKEIIDLDADILSSKYYIIDCFSEYVEAKNAITSRSFFINFIFLSEGYTKFIEENIVFRDIENLYTERTISFFNNEEKNLFAKDEQENLEELFDKWMAAGKKPILILGERGIGKSWSVLKFCLRYSKIHHEHPWTTPLPLYFNLRVLSENIPGVTNIGELVFYHLKTLYEINIFGNDFTFWTLLNTGQIILVLDGLDEMSKEVSKELSLKNLWQIFSLYSNSSKFILTSRINFFTSKMQIHEHFAFSKFEALKSFREKNIESIYNLEERRVRQDFNIWEIEQFRDIGRAELLSKARCLPDKFLEIGLKKLEDLEKYPENTIEREIYQLWDTPGYFLPILRLLASNHVASIEIYEQCIDNVIIEFNIETDRAIDKYRTTVDSQSIKGYVFDAKKKNEILRKLSWYMIERNLLVFNINDFPKFIKEIDGTDYDIVLNDLQTQTVITLKGEEKYSFINDSIFAFYVANHLFISLMNENKEQKIKGIRNIGKYSFSENKILKKTKTFLKAKIDNLKISKEDNVKIDSIYEFAIQVFNSDPPYSPWLKYLSGNLDLLGIKIGLNVLKKRDFWVNNPISNLKNETDGKMVLIPGDNVIKPFFLGETEITNHDYYQFLNSNEFERTAKDEDCLGHYWQRKEVFGEEKKLKNPYSKIINYYHIIFWTYDEIPTGKQDHPVVWVSWFAAAKYCNWLSRKGNLPTYYKFIIDNNGEFSKLSIDETSCGYRLPRENEWIFAANEGNSEAQTILDICKDEKEKEKIKIKFSEIIETTSPVKNENPNEFGVYGLMGNVREWVEREWHEDELKEVDRFGQQIIKGMGWLLGEEGLKFKHSSPLIAQNNNVDVGFRIARSLNQEELSKVKQAISNSCG